LEAKTLELRKYLKGWDKNNPVKVRKHLRRWQKKNKDKVSSLPLYYYQKDKEEYNRSIVNRRKKIRRNLYAKYGSKCQSCGYDRSLQALQFHHKDRNAKKLFRKNYPKYLFNSIDILKKEIEQYPERFILLCANCHAEVEEYYRDTNGESLDILSKRLVIRPSWDDGLTLLKHAKSDRDRLMMRLCLFQALREGEIPPDFFSSIYY